MTGTQKTNNDQADTEHNDAIRKYLNYYFDLKTPPKFAVLLTGKWGSGKSWFVNDVLKQKYGEHNKAGENYLSISLYGMASFGDIENEFFRQMHPFLSSKGAKFAGKLVKGLIKVSVNFDANGDGKSDGSLNAGVPSESLFGNTKPGNERPIIFDDVERCSIPIPLLLGYINQLVEQSDMHVILVANEEEIHNPSKLKKSAIDNGTSDAEEVAITPNSEYQRIKEKLIGQTFKVMPMVENAFDSFYADLQEGTGKTIVAENADEIKKIYRATKLENLRLLRYVLMEFCRFSQVLNDDLLKNKELIFELLTEYICYSMLLRSGEFHSDELELFDIGGSFYKIAGIKKDNQDKTDTWRERLPWINNFSPLISSDLWQAILSGGALPLVQIDQSLRNSRYFAEETSPNWVQLWHAHYQLNDDDFAKLLKLVIDEWDHKHYQHEGEVLHVFGMLIEFGKSRLHDRKIDDLIRQAKNYILQLKTEGKLDIPDKRALWPNMNIHCQLQFQSVETPDFIAIQQFLIEQKELSAQEALPSKAAELLKALKQGCDTFSFYRDLTYSSHGVGIYHDKPILAFINAKKFVAFAGDLHGQDLSNVASVFKDRYRNNP
jgi:hypothetical protein